MNEIPHIFPTNFHKYMKMGQAFFAFLVTISNRCFHFKTKFSRIKIETISLFSFSNRSKFENLLLLRYLFARWKMSVRIINNRKNDRYLTLTKRSYPDAQMLRLDAKPYIHLLLAYSTRNPTLTKWICSSEIKKKKKKKETTTFIKQSREKVVNSRPRIL